MERKRMTRSKGFWSVMGSILLGIVILLAGCGSSGSGSAAQQTIKIGVVGPMTGSAVDMGVPWFQGAQLAADEINAAGGIDGKKIDLIQMDDQGSPDWCVTVVQKLISDDKIVALLGPTMSGNCLAVEKIANDNKVLMFENGIVSKIISDQYPYVFRVTAQDTSQNDYVFQLAKKYKKIGIIHDTAGFGQGTSADFVKELAGAGLKPAANESYPMNATDVTPQVLRLKNAGVDVVVWFGAASDAATVCKAMQEQGLKVPMMGNNGIFPSALKIAGKALDGYTYADSVDGRNPRYQAFAQTFMKTYNYGPNFSQHEAAEGYDGMHLLGVALTKSKGQGGEALLQAVDSGISYQGATGRTSGGASLSQTKRNSLTEDQLTLHVIKDGNYEMAQ